MAQTSAPFDAGAGAAMSEATWQKLSRAYLGTGVHTGRLGELAVTASGAALSVSVATGQAQVEGFFYENDSALALTIATANATNPRIDTIVVRLDRTANTATLAVITGTAAASPVAPTLSATDALFEMPLANVTVPAAAGVIVAGNVTDRRTFAVQDVARQARHSSLSDLAGVSTTSTVYVTLAGGPDVSFVVPASLSALVVVSADMASSATYAVMSFELFDVTTNGVFQAPTDDRALFTANVNISASRLVSVTFLPEHRGRTFQARARYRAITGTASFARRSIVVMPSL